MSVTLKSSKAIFTGLNKFQFIAMTARRVAMSAASRHTTICSKEKKEYFKIFQKLENFFFRPESLPAFSGRMRFCCGGG